MKKLLKSMLSMIAVIAMVLSLTTVVNAVTVTVPDTGILKGHTFTAYQVFSGREEDGVLADVKWGSGINNLAFLGALKADTSYGYLFTNCDDAASVAKVLGDNNEDIALANAVAKLAYANKTGSGTALNSGDNNLNPGYYLIVDTTENVGKGGAYNAALLKIFGNNITIRVKTDVPSVEKKVLENVKYNQNGGYGTGYNDVADYNMDDVVTFHLIGEVPDMSRYDTYKYIFHDTLSNGLTLNEDSVKVYVASDKAGTNKTEITEWTKESKGQNFTVSFTDLKTVPDVSEGLYIIVEYTALLNQNAVVGLDGNPNTVYLEYSNKPDQSGSGNTNNTGNTPEDKVIVFTYELDVTKVDSQNHTTKLQGAEFKLKNSNDKWAIVNGDGKVTGWADTVEAGSILTSDDKGLFKVIGLDDGTYYLKETVAPTGYNLLSEEIEVVINANTNNGQNWIDGEARSALTNLTVTANGTDGTGNINNGTASITVTNTKGSTLPETGGIGNYVFYGVGGVLMMGAAYYFVRKRTGKII